MYFLSKDREKGGNETKKPLHRGVFKAFAGMFFIRQTLNKKIYINSMKK